MDSISGRLHPALWIFSFVLLLSNDISLNPGPVRYPCGVCYKPVCRNQKALLCDICELWSHCKCSGIDDKAYSCYQRMGYFTWNCPRCMAGSLPFRDCSFLSSEDSVVACDDISAVLGLPQASKGFLKHG